MLQRGWEEEGIVGRKLSLIGGIAELVGSVGKYLFPGQSLRVARGQTVNDVLCLHYCALVIDVEEEDTC